MLRIMTFNANGIRSAARKGFPQWLAEQHADILCLQEVRAKEEDLAPILEVLPDYGYSLHCAKKPGYSGAAVFSRVPPQFFKNGIGIEAFDDEGRFVEAHFENLVVISAYFPSGTSGSERQAVKYRFMDAFVPHVEDIRRSGKEIIVCGDFNIAHREIDIKNWKGNLKNSGFLPEERAWLTQLFDEHGWCDVFRRLDARPERYTWWSQRGSARAKNVGWRIDYQIATPGAAAAARAAEIVPNPKFSDHAPLMIDYDWELK